MQKILFCLEASFLENAKHDTNIKIAVEQDFLWEKYIYILWQIN